MMEKGGKFDKERGREREGEGLQDFPNVTVIFSIICAGTKVPAATPQNKSKRKIFS